MNRRVEVEWPPIRIVSLVPSQTELLYDLGLQNEVVGQTLFCIHPAQMHEVKPRIGGTKNFSLEKIAALNPDLIIGNKEENDQQRIEQLEKLYPVWMSDIEKLDDSIDMITKVGELVNRKEEALVLSRNIERSFDLLAINRSFTGNNCLYLIWRNPWMAAGRNTFINDMLGRLQLKNSAVDFESRYPQLGDEELKAIKPDIILLSSEPYPFKQKHMAELQALCPNAIIKLVDGEVFSWYGSRLAHSAAYFNTLLSDLAQ